MKRKRRGKRPRRWGRACIRKWRGLLWGKWMGRKGWWQRGAGRFLSPARARRPKRARTNRLLGWACRALWRRERRWRSKPCKVLAARGPQGGRRWQQRAWQAWTRWLCLVAVAGEPVSRAALAAVAAAAAAQVAAAAVAFSAALLPREARPGTERQRLAPQCGCGSPTRASTGLFAWLRERPRGICRLELCCNRTRCYGGQ